MPVRMALLIGCLFLQAGVAVVASDSSLERLLRLQVFNQAFEGFDYYHVRIEDDRSCTDGSREVTAVASGRFLESTKRMKVLVLMAEIGWSAGRCWRKPDCPRVSCPSRGVGPNRASL